MNPDHLFSPSALGGSLPDGPQLLTKDPHRFLARIGSPTPVGTRVHAELLPEHQPPPIVVPTRDPPRLTPELTALFATLRDAHGADATDLKNLTAGAVTDPSQVRYAPDGELVLALPMVADLPARLGLPNWPKLFGRPHPDELTAPGALQILPDVDIHDTPGTGLRAMRNGRTVPLGTTPTMRTIIERLTETAPRGTTPAELAAATPNLVLGETIAAWLVRAGVAGRASSVGSHHRLWLKAGATPHGADQAAIRAPTFDSLHLPAPITRALRAMRLRCDPDASTQIRLLHKGFSDAALHCLEHQRHIGITTIPVFRSGPDRILVGPWLAPEGQPCPHCWHATLQQAASRPDLALPLRPATTPDQLPEAIGLYVAKHLIGLDRRRIVFSIRIRSGAITKHPVIPNPTCPNCGHDTTTALPGEQSPIDVTTLPGLLDSVTGAVGVPRTPHIPLTVDPNLRAAFHIAFASWVRRGGAPHHRELAVGKGRTPQGAHAGALAEALERRSLCEIPTHLLPATRLRGSPEVTGPILETNQVDLYGSEQRPGHADGTSVHPHNARIPRAPLARRPLPHPAPQPRRNNRTLDRSRTRIPPRRANLSNRALLQRGRRCPNTRRGHLPRLRRTRRARCHRPVVVLHDPPTGGPARSPRDHPRARSARRTRPSVPGPRPHDPRPLHEPGTPYRGRRLFPSGEGDPCWASVPVPPTPPLRAAAIGEIWQNLNPETGENRLANRDPIRRAINQLTRISAPWLKPRGVERDLVDTPVANTPLDLTKRTCNALDVDVFWIELTDPHLPLPVARVFAPGLRHFWRRTAPGRLYDEPYRLGWSRRPLSPRDLNRLELLI